MVLLTSALWEGELGFFGTSFLRPLDLPWAVAGRFLTRVRGELLCSLHLTTPETCS